MLEAVFFCSFPVRCKLEVEQLILFSSRRDVPAECLYEEDRKDKQARCGEFEEKFVALY